MRSRPLPQIAAPLLHYAYCENQHHEQGYDEAVANAESDLQRRSRRKGFDSEIARNPSHHGKPRLKRVRAKEQLADEDDRQRPDGLERSIRPAIAVDAEVLRRTRAWRLDQAARHDQDEVVQTEEDVLAAGAMPQAVADPHAEQRNGACQKRTVSVSETLARLGRQHLAWLGQRDRVVHVVFEPQAQRDMPTLPEFGGGAGEERLPEVFGQRYVEHAAHAQGDVHRS